MLMMIATTSLASKNYDGFVASTLNYGLPSQPNEKLFARCYLVIVLVSYKVFFIRKTVLIGEKHDRYEDVICFVSEWWHDPKWLTPVPTIWHH